MKQKTVILTAAAFIIIPALFFILRADNDRTNNGPQIAAANSYLTSSVKDLMGDETKVLNLVPPGMCPGHFDITPGQIRQLAGCEIIIIFEFQKRIADALARFRDRGVKIHTVKSPGGLCIPES